MTRSTMSPAARVNRILLVLVTAVVVVSMTLGTVLRPFPQTPTDRLHEEGTNP